MQGFRIWPLRADEWRIETCFTPPAQSQSRPCRPIHYTHALKLGIRPGAMELAVPGAAGIKSSLHFLNERGGDPGISSILQTVNRLLGERIQGYVDLCIKLFVFRKEKASS